MCTRAALVVALVAALLCDATDGLDNGRALTPVQGWTAWNSLVFHPTQDAVEAAMRGLAKQRNATTGQPVTPEAYTTGTATSTTTTTTHKSLVDLGYAQANLDDGWQDCGAGVNGAQPLSPPTRLNTFSLLRLNYEVHFALPLRYAVHA